MSTWYLCLLLLYWRGVSANSEGIDLVVLTSSFNISVGVGDYLVCVGYSELGVNITWTLNNQTLTSDRVSESDIEEGNKVFRASFLGLCDAQVDDSGMYSCNISNGRTSIQGNIVVYVLLESTPQTTTQVTTQDVPVTALIGGIVGAIVGVTVIIIILSISAMLIITKNRCEKPMKCHDTIYEEIPVSGTSSKITETGMSNGKKNFQDGSGKNFENISHDLNQLTDVHSNSDLVDLTMSSNEAYSNLNDLKNDEIYYT